MRTRVLVAAATLLAACAIAGCERAVPGTVAMTTEPGFTSPSSTLRPTTPRSSTPRTSSNVPPPQNALTMTCEEYSDLDPDTQQAVIDEILAQEGSVLAPGNADIAKTLADAVCTFLPDGTVSEVLLGGPPP